MDKLFFAGYVLTDEELSQYELEQYYEEGRFYKSSMKINGCVEFMYYLGSDFIFDDEAYSTTIRNIKDNAIESLEMIKPELRLEFF